MYPFDRFTDAAQEALKLAQEEAAAAHHSYIGTEHLLLGLLREERGIAGQALGALGVRLDEVREAIEATLGRNVRIVVTQVIPTSRVRKAVEIAVDEARRAGQADVWTHHLLLGLVIEGDGVAAHVLADLGAGLEAIRAEVRRLLEAGGAEPRGQRWVPQRHARELAVLLLRAHEETERRGSAETGLDELLTAMAATDAGTEAMAHMLDLRSAAARKQRAIAAGDDETVTRHDREELAARERLEAAIGTWGKELGGSSHTGNAS
ncbi:MAG TPA: Clp protease N-terminal domain-containing protein [Candidatus Dormibacteraeota bacterium]|nr:Clp protease N-terminal domain-containing protein [Candidatus Dormibacteraeota bacterium]